MTSLLRVFALFAISCICSAVEWKLISPEELSLASPKIEKTADAEALFWEVRVYDHIQSLPYVNHHVEHYIRLKIFNERGVKEHSTVNIPYSSLFKQTIIDIRGRTIRPDGTIVELKKDAVFDKTDVKVGRRTLLKTKSFTFADVTPGSIIEYQWHEVYSEYFPRYNKLEFQRDFPIHKVTYFVRPLVHEAFNSTMRAYPFNCDPPNWVQVKEGMNDFVTTSLSNVPAFADEPDSPSDEELKQWMLLYYSPESNPDLKKYWPKLGKQLHGEFNQKIKVNGDVKALATEAVGDASTPEQKLDRIAEFCRTKIKNVSFLTAGITAEEKSNFKRPDKTTSADTAKRRMGFPEDINYLFAAMAQAQGFEVRGVQGSTQLSALMRPNLPDPYLLRSEFVAVKLADEWKYFNLDNPYRPAGMVEWDEESVPALLLDNKEPVLFQMPASRPDINSTKRKAALKLHEDGSLTGQITVTVQGHSATRLKSSLEEKSEAKRIEDVEETIRMTHGDVELSEVRIENVTDPLKPLVYSYQMTVRNYAEKTGKRLFFQPAFFRHGLPARFVAQERKNPILFRHPFQEEEEVVIELPSDYSLEKAEGITPLTIGEVATYTHALFVTKDGKKLTSKRKLVWGIKGELFYPRESYPQLKSAWDQIHSRDGHMLALKANQ